MSREGVVVCLVAVAVLSVKVVPSVEVEVVVLRSCWSLQNQEC